MERSGRLERISSKRDSRKTKSRSPVKNRSPSPKKKPRTFSKYRRYAARSSSSSSSFSSSSTSSSFSSSSTSSSSSSSSTSSLQPCKSKQIATTQSVEMVLKPKETVEDNKGNKKSKTEKVSVARKTKIKRVEGFRSSKHSSFAEGQTYCRDYNDVGFCVLGDECPFDHGEDPVVTHVLPVIPSKSKSSGHYPPHRLNRRQCAPTIGEYHPEHPGFGPGFGWPQFPPMKFNNPLSPRQCAPTFWGHNPQHPGFRHGVGWRPLPLIRFQTGPWPAEQMFPPHPMVSQEHALVDLSFHKNQNTATSTLQPVRYEDDFGRHNPESFAYEGIKKKKQENTSLVVKKIPVELNNIQDLNGHFLRFGKIVNIQINFENNPESALITFANKWEAETAFGCTDAVFNNRFIRVAWYKEFKEVGNNEAPISEVVPAVPVKQPPSVPYIGYKEDEVFSEGTNQIWTANNTESTQADGEHHVLSNQDSQANKVLHLKAKKLNDELRKRRQDMADKQIQQQKLLISKLETSKASMKPEDRQELMSIIKSLQQSIEGLIKVNGAEEKSGNENP